MLLHLNRPFLLNPFYRHHRYDEVAMTSHNGRLEVFQDLVLRGPEGDRSTLRHALIALAAPPWQHAQSKEDDMSAHAVGDVDVIVFEREAGAGFNAAALVLWSRPDGYEVTNIVPREVRELGYSGYNAILQDFARHLAEPAARQVGFSLEITAAEQTLQDWLSPEAAEALKRFSAAANKSTGSSHPSDRRRWFDFLLQVHADKRRLDADQLARWLIEVERWSDDTAHDLVVQYEFGLELLDEYVQRGS
jgi:hypothetical protein